MASWRTDMTFAELITPAQLAVSYAAVLRRTTAPGSDGITAEDFGRDLAPRLDALARDLREERYAPARLVRLKIDKPSGGTRRLAISTVAARVVIEGLRRALSG